MEGLEQEQDESELRLWDNPAFAKETLRYLTKNAATGDEDAAGQIAKVRAARPDLAPVIDRMIEDLSQTAEAAWISLVSAGRQFAADGLRAKVAAMKAEMRLETSGALKEILIDDVVVSYLANVHTNAMAAQAAGMPGDAHLDRRVVSAQRRMANSIKTWQQFVRKSSKLNMPPVGPPIEATLQRKPDSRRYKTNGVARRRGR